MGGRVTLVDWVDQQNWTSLHRGHDGVRKSTRVRFGWKGFRGHTWRPGWGSDCTLHCADVCALMLHRQFLVTRHPRNGLRTTRKLPYSTRRMVVVVSVDVVAWSMIEVVVVVGWWWMVVGVCGCPKQRLLACLFQMLNALLCIIVVLQCQKTELLLFILHYGT